MSYGTTNGLRPSYTPLPARREKHLFAKHNATYNSTSLMLTLLTSWSTSSCARISSSVKASLSRMSLMGLTGTSCEMPPSQASEERLQTRAHCYSHTGGSCDNKKQNKKQGKTKQNRTKNGVLLLLLYTCCSPFEAFFRDDCCQARHIFRRQIPRAAVPTLHLCGKCPRS